MNFKQLLITTIACSHVLQFACADIILQDAQSGRVTIFNNTKFEYALQDNIFQADEGVTSIQLKNIKALNKTQKTKLKHTFRSFIDGQYTQNQTQQIEIEIDDCDETVTGIYQYILKNIKNISNLQLTKLQIDKFIPTCDLANDLFAENATLKINRANTSATVDLSNFHHSNIKTIEIETPIDTSYTSYLRIKDYSKFSGLTELSITGDVYWADYDNADSYQTDECKNYQNEVRFKGFHGAAFCTIIIPSTLQKLKLDFWTWYNYRSIGYQGYTGIGLDVTQAKEDLKLYLGEKTSYLYLSNLAESYSPKILTSQQVHQLQDITVPEGNWPNNDVYQVTGKTNRFLLGGKGFNHTLKEKSQAKTQSIKLPWRGKIFLDPSEEKVNFSTDKQRTTAINAAVNSKYSQE